MEEDLGKGLKIKLQDELIGDKGTYKRKTGINRFKTPTQTKKDKFVDAQSDILSTIPRTEEHADFDALNNNFSDRLNKIEKKIDLPKGKDKKIEEKDDINKNKKRIVTMQGQREDSDSE
ncbi:hypothetical protein RhiirA1_477749 [Rhizophagus irregularis]|uniref:Uncharacterized protein n=1 Tax=Rhizophagus irregularis TaxID=588596 RepID=A0A2N0QT45_9GLOM|nr:hypothetical protein RhiirA1_477749 [Rhizophagus irregularis]